MAFKSYYIVGNLKFCEFQKFTSMIYNSHHRKKIQLNKFSHNFLFDNLELIEKRI